MPLTRRAFHRTILLGLAGAALSGKGAQAATSDPDLRFLNRFTFGARPEDHADLARLGRMGWLEDQLARHSHDPAFDARLSALRLRINYDAGDNGEGGTWSALDELRPLTYLDAAPDAGLPLIDWDKAMAWDERVRPAQEVIAASLPRAVHAPAQLLEMMTQFWHDHFNVHAMKNEFAAIHFPAYDRTLRDGALGNFRALLGQVAQSPAMLVYLNNDESRASPANENFGRELLELHTLGAGNYLNDRYNRWHDVPGASEGAATGYIDEDVYEVARAFTGWTVGDGRWLADGAEAPKTGLFHYADQWHDPYQKRVLGHEMGPNRAPLADGEEVLDILATHPGTAQFICTKLARRFVTDDPDPAFVGRLVAVFLAASDAPDQIAQVIRTIATDPAFDVPPAKLRRPFEVLAALYRASGVEVASPEASFAWQLSRAGWMQHTFPPPTGHPDRAEDWITSTYLVRLVDLLATAHDDWFGCTTTGLETMLPATVKTCGDLAAFWAGRLGTDPGDTLPDLMTAIGSAPTDPLPPGAEDRRSLASMTLAMAALSPTFLYR